MSAIRRLIERMKARLQGGTNLKLMRDEKDDESYRLQPRAVITA